MGECEDFPNRWASSIPSAHRVQGPRQHLSSLPVVCDPLPLWPYARFVSRRDGNGQQEMVIQFLRLFGMLVGVILGIGQLKPRFNGNFAEQQHADIPAQARRRVPSNEAHERCSTVRLLGVTVVRRLKMVSDGRSVGTGHRYTFDII